MDRCPGCSGKHNCIPGNGPVPCDLLFIGEAGGYDEDRTQIPFTGKTGEEVNRGYLPLAALRREKVRFTNVIKCMPDTAKGKLDIHRAKDLELLDSCATAHLYNEIAECRATVIITLGVFAAYALDPSIDLEIHHGIPRWTKFGWVFPMFHPAGGLHEPKKMLQIRSDWIKLKRYLKGTLYIPTDEYAGKEEYAEVTHADEVDDLLCGHWRSPLACDTETKWGGDPFCLTFSVQPGTGYLIRAGRTDLLERFQQHLRLWRAEILFHNWLFDFKVVSKMGLVFPQKRILDTMVKVFHLGNLPQGLKALAYRELGMEMQDFDDLVKPYSTQRVLEYFRRAYDHPWERPEEQIIRDPQGNLKVYKPQSMKTKLKRFFTDYMKNEEKDVFKMWSDNWEDHQAEIEAVVGPYPGKDICHAPLNEVVHYACRDADATLRLWPVLKAMQRQVRRQPQDNWRRSVAA